MSDLCVLGEYLIDFTPQGLSDRGLPLYTSNPGGAPANVACAAAKLGTTASVITKISTDPFGNFLYDYIKGLGIVDLRGIRRSSDPTGLAFVTLNAEGDRDFVFFRDHCADAMLSCEDMTLGTYHSLPGTKRADTDDTWRMGDQITGRIPSLSRPC